MKKTFKLKNLGCANCAAKMEAKIKALPGVNGVIINFMISRLTLDADEMRFNEIVTEAAKICSKIEPDCVLVV